MPDIWFVLGVAAGSIVTGLCAIGSFDRGADSVRRKSWSAEHAARKRAFLLSRRAVAQPIVEAALPRAG